MINPGTGLTATDVKKALEGMGSEVGELFTKPDSDKPLFEKVSAYSIKIQPGFTDVVGGKSIQAGSDCILDLDTDFDGETNTPGTDYYVYAKSDNTFYISDDKEITDDKLIGGFHYGLTAENEAPTGNKTEDDMVAIRGINKYSFWDLKFRPISNPEGMVLIGSKWYDIYLLNSEHIANGTSKANLAIAGRVAPKIPLEYGGDGTVNYGKFTWFQACEIAKSHSKELIDYAEFSTIAYGVFEGKSSIGYEVEIGKIEHYPELTSKYGIEQATGTQGIWGKNVGGNRDEGSVDWSLSTSRTDSRGGIYALNDYHITAPVLGHNRYGGVNAGSRASDWSNAIQRSNIYIGCRFSCNHLKLV